jgi:hypothetical protein
VNLVAPKAARRAAWWADSLAECLAAPLVVLLVGRKAVRRARKLVDRLVGKTAVCLVVRWAGLWVVQLAVTWAAYSVDLSAAVMVQN